MHSHSLLSACLPDVFSLILFEENKRNEVNTLLKSIFANLFIQQAKSSTFDGVVCVWAGE